MTSAATVPSKESELQAHESHRHDAELARWQRSLLPVMTLFVTVLAILFFVFSTSALRGVDSFVQSEHGELRDEIKGVIAQVQTPQSADDALRRGLLLLEADALDRRYHQATALLLSRIWAKHLAFMTGMIMAFLGSIFILGKLSESPSALSGGGSQWNVSVTSASPGILLAFFGTALMAISIVIQGNIDVHDGPAYLRSVVLQSGTQTGATEPASGAVDQNILDKLKGLNQKTPPESIPGKK